ncbi:hypothetical protein BDZ91DRAFT_766387 [Kalaharituber pfeilii]|nr:hypothetical protein BDZ91DRAFT_766387 [Kalaharituber pfeilii]
MSIGTRRKSEDTATVNGKDVRGKGKQSGEWDGDTYHREEQMSRIVGQGMSKEVEGYMQIIWATAGKSAYISLTVEITQNTRASSLVKGVFNLEKLHEQNIRMAPSITYPDLEYIGAIEVELEWAPGLLVNGLLFAIASTCLLICHPNITVITTISPKTWASTSEVVVPLLLILTLTNFSDGMNKKQLHEALRAPPVQESYDIP